MNLLRNRDTQVDKKTCCGISNSSKNAIQGKRQVPRLLRKGSMVANYSMTTHRKELTYSGSQKDHCKKKRNRDIDTIVNLKGFRK
jgi:hypothetical protein